MSVKDDFKIEPISSKLANQIMVENHYLHRKASAMFSFGLFDKNEKIVGAIIFGKPASPALCRGVCGESESSNVIELTRLWIQDGTPKNTESFLIGGAIRLLPKTFPIIVSYAEIQAGHVGTVYQATNWIYTGLSDKHVQWSVADSDSNKHGRHLFDELGGINKAKEILGDRMVRSERPRKHRYVFFNASGRRRKELMAKLRYKVAPYPKVKNESESVS